jgi:hypothetical protein
VLCECGLVLNRVTTAQQQDAAGATAASQLEERCSWTLYLIQEGVDGILGLLRLLLTSTTVELYSSSQEGGVGLGQDRRS